MKFYTDINYACLLIKYRKLDIIIKMNFGDCLVEKTAALNYKSIYAQVFIVKLYIMMYEISFVLKRYF